MPTTSLTKVGNSMAVLLPKALREEAGIESSTPLHVASPRKGVVVITALLDDKRTRLERFEKALQHIEENSEKMKPWLEGKSAQDLIEEAKDAKTKEFLSL